MKLHNFSFAKLFVFFVVLLSLLNFIKFIESPNSIAGQTASSKILLNLLDNFPEEQEFVDIDYVKGILIRCRYYIIQEEEVVRMLREWQNLILSNTNMSNIDKLNKVNLFFNQLEFVNDIDNWGEDDYWTTPTEFVRISPSPSISLFVQWAFLKDNLA